MFTEVAVTKRFAVHRSDPFVGYIAYLFQIFIDKNLSEFDKSCFESNKYLEYYVLRIVNTIQ